MLQILISVLTLSLTEEKSIDLSWKRSPFSLREKISKVETFISNYTTLQNNIPEYLLCKLMTKKIALYLYNRLNK